MIVEGVGDGAGGAEDEKVGVTVRVNVPSRVTQYSQSRHDGQGNKNYI